MIAVLSSPDLRNRTKGRTDGSRDRPDRAAAKRAFDAMMTMKKIDIATIEAARRGTTRA
jgi:hypothetical protein